MKKARDRLFQGNGLYAIEQVGLAKLPRTLLSGSGPGAFQSCMHLVAGGYVAYQRRFLIRLSTQLTCGFDSLACALVPG